MRRLALAAASLLVALAAPAAAQAKELFATVGPGFTITLRDDQGRDVTQLDPGDYRIVVEDRSDFHNFHLIGPGVDRATEVEGMGTVTWEVTLVEGRFEYQCDPHSDSMSGRFVVGNPPPLPKPKRLVATVTARAITLTLGGVRVRTLAPGTYVIVVRDRSRKHNFHLLGQGVNRKTTVRAFGTFTWTVTFRPGTYTYRSDPQARKLRGSFSVVGQRLRRA